MERSRQQQPRRRTPSAWRRRGSLRAAAPPACALALASLILCACGAGAQTGTTASAYSSPAAYTAAGPAPLSIAEPPCGAASARTAATTLLAAAENIYRGELSSPEVRADASQVEHYAPLLRALESGNRAAVGEAVTSLVYSGTHIVRLRVSRGGAVLSDVGGPYIIAPVSGRLRNNGRELGRYVLSVQDDLGYVKLESRYLGLPLILRAGGPGGTRIPLEGTIPAGKAIPSTGPVRYGGATREAISFTAKAFPSGSLGITLIVPVPVDTTAGCTAIRVAELGHVGARMWGHFASVGAPASAYAHVVGALTSVLVYVRAGSRHLAASVGPGPSRLPDSGVVVYRGVHYRVASFPAHGPMGAVRVYMLIRP